MKVQNLVLAVCILFLLWSCGASKPRNPRYINTPLAQTPSFFKEKGDWNMSFNASASLWQLTSGKNNRTIDGTTIELEKNYARGLRIQGGYAFSNHFMLTLSASHFKEADHYFDNDLIQAEIPSTVRYNKNTLDVGLGYYTPLSEKVYFNAIGGYSIGSLKSSINGINDIFYFNSTTHKYYAAPALNFFLKPRFRMALMPKLSFLSYRNIHTNYNDERLEDLQLSRLYRHTFTFFEPSLVFQWGFKQVDWLKLDIGLHFSSNPDLYRKKSIFDDSQNIASRTFLVSAGISIYPEKRK